MKFHLGDKFLVKNIECQVRFITGAGVAWVAPVESGVYDGKTLHSFCVFESINEKGLTSSGERAKAIINIECQAV